MKIILMIISLCLACSFAFAADIGKIEKDANGQLVHGAAPRGDKTVTLTGISYTTDGQGVWWAAYCAADAKFRSMATATKANAQATIPATTWTGFVINKTTPFVNISGCTGTLLRQ